jgi:hypothetical protein
MSTPPFEIFEKDQIPLMTHLPAPPSVGTGAGRQELDIDYTNKIAMLKSM